MGTPVTVIPDDAFAGLALTEHPQGALCVLKRPLLDQAPGPLADPFVLVLDRLGDPGNLGTILRTAWAVGLGQVWLTRGGVDPFGPKAVRAGMGAQFAMALHRVQDLAAAQELLCARQCLPLWCAVAQGGVSCFADTFDLRGAALVIGNEASGIRDPSVGRCVTIPMPGQADSLNAAQAATVLLFEALRRGVIACSGAD